MTTSLQILVIEDNEQDFLLLVRHLERSQLACKCTRADTPGALAKALAEPEAHWNIVLSDYNLPGIDIRETICQLAAAHPETPIIIISGTIGEETVIDLLRAGVADFVSKDNLTRLVPAINRAVDAAATRRAQQHAERELQLRDRALSAATNGVIITRADGDMPVVYLNPAFETITGYRADEMLGRNCRVLQGDDRQQPEIAKIYTALSQGEGCQAVVRNYRKNGSAFWNRMSIWPVKDASSRTTHFVGIQEDITEQRQADDRLRQAAAVFESSTEGMMITDLSAKIIEVNRAFTEITGYEHDEVIGMSSSLLRSGQHPPQFYQSLWRSLQESGQWRGEVWNRRKNGEIYPEWLTLSTVYDDDGTPVFYTGVFSDITRVKQSAQKLEHLAHHDPLTDLPNRMLLNARLMHASCTPSSTPPAAVCHWRCCSSTWIVSRTSTMFTDTRLAMNSFGRWPAGCATASGSTTPSPGWAATNSWSCSKRSRRPTVPCWSPKKSSSHSISPSPSSSASSLSPPVLASACSRATVATRLN